MFSRTKRRPRFSISSTLTRRWIRSRPGSVLILVIALLVLLALIGTAYLSSTQTERYTSVQNTINTEADLLIDGLKIALNADIAGGVFGNNNIYRQPSQEMATYPGDVPTQAPAHSRYFNYDSMAGDQGLIPEIAGTPPLVDAPDLFLADRIPTIATAVDAGEATDVPVWSSISWPLFQDNGGYTFDSPFATTPVHVGAGIYKSRILCKPKSVTLNGTVYPAMQFYIPGGKQVVQQDGTAVTGGNLTPNLLLAADADGDGIADSALFKLPLGPIDGITYYAATRVIDSNSAVNASTAWSSSSDFMVSAGFSDTTTSQIINYGFFRSNIGLREMLSGSTVSAEMSQLNAYRFNSQLPVSPLPATPPTVAMNLMPVGDDKYNPPTSAGSTPVPTARTDFSWYSLGDALEQQLARRSGNPGNADAAGTKFRWLGTAQSAVLAYKFALVSPTSSQSIIEQLFPTETYNTTGAYNYVKAKTTPYSPAQTYASASGTPAYDKTGYWFGDLFNFASTTVNMPLRTILTADNPVSNAVPSLLGNISSSGPPPWNIGTTYEFGDWVTYNSTSYVCMLHNVGQTPLAPNTLYAAAPEYWTTVPWTTQPVKTSINTATFNQLWLGFCQVMTDSIQKSAALVPQWQPPMLSTVQQGNYNEKQQQMFRSVIRDNRNYPIVNDTGVSSTTNTGNPETSLTSTTRVQLTPMQMMQLRAAIAAINTQAMRNYAPVTGGAAPPSQQVRSHHIVLPDTSGAPAFDAEVFSTDMQPYIGQVYAVADTSGNNFVAIQLLNPYPVDIVVTSNWGIATIDRHITTSGTTPDLALTSVYLAPADFVGFTVPAASATTGPGVVTIYDGVTPGKFTLPPTAKLEKGLVSAIGKELVILRPRLFNNTLSSSTGADTYTETAASGSGPNLYELVPVDQIDLTGADTLASSTGKTQFLIYKRAGASAAAPPTYTWNFVWPGFYTPYNPSNSNTGISTNSTTPILPPSGTTPTAQTGAQYPLSQAIVAVTTEPPAVTLDFTALPGGKGFVYDPANPDNPPAVTDPTYNTIPLQLNNVGFPGTNPIVAPPNNTFPFGGFARNGDILQVPFIGAYRISDYLAPPDNSKGNNAAHMFYEMNSVTMDSSLANDSTLQPSNATSPAYTTVYPKKVLPSPGGYASGGANFAADSVSDPFVEQIGRFYPVGDPAGTTLEAQLDFGSGFATVVSGATELAAEEKVNWHYHWAKRIFDYFTVQSPQDDYFPNNVDPAGPNPDALVAPVIPAKFPNATGNANPNTTDVIPVNNSQTTASTSANYFANANVPGKSEDTVGVQGLININTAPWPVLARLPFVAPGTDNINYSGGVLTPTPPTPPTAPAASPNLVDDNIDIAKAIVDYRNHNGPFQSIYDLYKVPAFQLENEFVLATDPVCAKPNTPPVIPPLAATPSPVGDFSGGPTATVAAPTADGVRLDWEEHFILLNNVSNLITTRSDTFTCYVLLQGWRNVGTANPTLAVQRRVSFLVDRNAVTPANTQTTTFTVPSN